MASGAGALGKRLKDDHIVEVCLSAHPGSIADADETAGIARRQNAAWVALHGYQFSPDYQHVLKDRIVHLLLLDDLGDADSYHANLLLNQNAYARPEMYGTRAGDNTLLLSADYLNAAPRIPRVVPKRPPDRSACA